MLGLTARWADLCDPLPHLLAPFFCGILLLVLLEQNQQVDVLPLLQLQVQIAVATTFSLATAGIRNTGFAHTTEARNHVASVRLLHELSLNRPQQFVGSATELVEPSGKGPGLNEYHSVILSQCDMSINV